MIDRLSEAQKRYDEIEREIANPEASSDTKKFASLMKEYKNLTPIIELYREYISLQAQDGDAKELLQSGDADMREAADEEHRALCAKISQTEEKLKQLLLPRDENDDRNVIIEIRAGTGGEEAALFAAALYRMYSMYAARAGFKCEFVGANETELGGYKEISFIVSGEGAYSRFKFEGGVHRVQRVPETETQGRIHTSTATVAVLPEVDDVDVEIKDSDLKIETCKSSGAGGQHVNKTESAIRIIHIPTGMVIECQDERSQFKNREKAMKTLRARLYDMKTREQNDMIALTRKSQVGSGDRSVKIRTYNYPQGRVTDHRIGFTLYSLENFLCGDIGEMIDALITADTAEKLKGNQA